MATLAHVISRKVKMTRIVSSTIRVSLFLILQFSILGILHGETLGPEKGVLFIHGGGAFNPGEFVSLAKKASGKDQPVIRVITTPQGKRRVADYKKGIPFRMVANLKKRFGLETVTELYTLSREEADTPDFYEQIDSADAVFLSGGNQSFLTDAFLGTETLEALRRLLARGGVIGGSSAGAQVQSSFMTRGDYNRRIIMGDKKHQVGFGFITNSAFDVHVEERDRQEDLLRLFRAKKSQLEIKGLDTLEILGIGIDQGTAITVVKNSFRVSGRGVVYIFDPLQWGDDPKTWGYYELESGTFFNMKSRKVINR
ncbi:MAG: cyanophycinase [Candidatus Pelagisphaera sp.]|jgi:cyanophycinase